MDIEEITITIRRKDDGETIFSFIRPEKIEELIENEPFIKALVEED